MTAPDRLSEGRVALLRRLRDNRGGYVMHFRGPEMREVNTAANAGLVRIRNQVVDLTDAGRAALATHDAATPPVEPNDAR